MPDGSRRISSTSDEEAENPKAAEYQQWYVNNPHRVQREILVHGVQVKWNGVEGCLLIPIPAFESHIGTIHLLTVAHVTD